MTRLAGVPAAGGRHLEPLPTDRPGVSAAAAPAHQGALHGDRRPYRVGAAPDRLSRSGRFQPHRAPCVFSADALGAPARAQGQAPCRTLARADRTRSTTRARPCARRCAQHGATALDDLDDAFWRLADRGYARFLEAFDWVLAYREVLPEWAQTIAVSKTVQTVLKTQGLSRAHRQRVKAELAALEPLAAPVADFRTRLLEHVEQEAAKLPAGATWLASSDIIESVFGHYKTFTARGPLKEVGRLVLLIPAFLSELRPRSSARR
jgi:hypothetical protein